MARRRVGVGRIVSVRGAAAPGMAGEATAGMRIAVTGSAGRIGAAVCRAARARGHAVVGIDRVDGPRVTAKSDVGDGHRLARLFEGVDAVLHCAGLHAPHVGVETDDAFRTVNVGGTASVLRAAVRCEVKRLVLTSSTAVLGGGSEPGEPARWIDDRTPPVARTIYHETKLAAEVLVRDAAGPQLRASIVRLGRCVPEPPALVAFHLLCRGIGVRNAADAHLAALGAADGTARPLIACAITPFEREDADLLGRDARAAIDRRCPEVARAFNERGWLIPERAGRVYDGATAHERWDWTPENGADAAIGMSV